MKTLLTTLVIIAVSWIFASCAPDSAGETTYTNQCAFPSEAVTVAVEGPSVLKYWLVEDSDLWSQPVLPADSAYLAYRQFIRETDADEIHPVQHIPEDERENDIWKREHHNLERAFSGEAGLIRPVQCLDALLFAQQHARFSQLEQPTEFIASFLSKQVDGRSMLKIYFSASDVMFPPKAFYGFDQARKDVEEGWTYRVVLHNHTIQEVGDSLRLGVPAPSASDVHLLRNITADTGLEAAWVTNGMYTIEIPTVMLAQYQGN